MLNLEFSVDTTQFKKKLDTFKTKNDRLTKDHLRRAGLHAESVAKVMSEPRDTGRLRSSIHLSIVKNGYVAKVSTNVEYAGYIEFGTSRIPARRFMQKAQKKGVDKFLKLMNREKS